MWYCEHCMHGEVCGLKDNVEGDAFDKNLCSHFLKIVFLCDKRDKCKICYPDCNHTRDISHAKNFQRVGHPSEGLWEEIIPEE